MKFKTFAAALALAALLVGCSQETQQQVEDTSQSVASDVKEGAKDAMETTKEVASDMDLTASVKTALMASDKIDSSALNVDTVDGTVFLKGSVPDDMQKTLAEEIAKNTAPENTMIKNELAVGAAADGDSDTATATPDAEGATPAEGAVVTPDGDATPVEGAVVDPNATATPHTEGDGHNHDGEDHSGHDHD